MLTVYFRMHRVVVKQVFKCVLQDALDYGMSTVVHGERGNCETMFSVYVHCVPLCGQTMFT